MPTNRARVQKPTGSMAAFASAQRGKNTFILGPVERMLITDAQQPDPDRREDIIHPSEIAKSDWCPRSTYLRLAGKKQEYTASGFALEKIWQYGTDAHKKWQKWLWRAGELFGKFKCRGCKHEWMGVSPETCPKCKKGRELLKYLEVPLEDEAHLLGGHADGQWRPRGATTPHRMIEVKTVALGTVRIEAPKMLAAYTRKVVYLDRIMDSRFPIDEVPPELIVKWVDIEALWRDIHRPFASHLRQGSIYLFLRALLMPEVTQMTYLYESKMHQGTKEFTVRFDMDDVEDMLGICRSIKYALETGKDIPDCIKPGKCKACGAFKGENDGNSTSEKKPGRRRRIVASRSTSPGSGALPTPTPRGQPARAAGRPVRGEQRGSNKPASPAHSLGRLLGG